MGQVWFFLTLTVLFWGLAPILEKYGLKSVDAFNALFIRSFAVFFVLGIMCLFNGKMKELANVPPKAVLVFVLSGLLAGLLGLFTYFKVLKIAPSSKVVPITAIYPLVTAVLSYIILREGFSWQKVIGTVFIVAGVLLVK
jgi:transporter family protein